MIVAAHRISRELRCKCVSDDEIIDNEADTGVINACPTCGARYINDTGIWRNVLTLGTAKVKRLQNHGRAQRLTKHLA